MIRARSAVYSSSEMAPLARRFSISCSRCVVGATVGGASPGRAARVVLQGPNRGARLLAEVEQPEPQQQNQQADASDRQAEVERPTAGQAEFAQRDKANHER